MGLFKKTEPTPMIMTDTEFIYGTIRLTITEKGYVDVLHDSVRNQRIPLRHIETVTVVSNYDNVDNNPYVLLTIYGRGVTLGSLKFHLNHSKALHAIQDWILHKIDN